MLIVIPEGQHAVAMDGCCLAELGFDGLRLRSPSVPYSASDRWATLDVYGHVLPTDDTAAAAKVAGLILGG